MLARQLDDELRRAMDHTGKHEYTRELDDEHGGVFFVPHEAAFSVVLMQINRETNYLRLGCDRAGANVPSHAAHDLVLAVTTPRRTSLVTVRTCA